MAKFSISFKRYKIDPNGRKGGATSSTKTIEAPTSGTAISIIESQYPGYHVEFTKVVEK